MRCMSGFVGCNAYTSSDNSLSESRTVFTRSIPILQFLISLLIFSMNRGQTLRGQVVRLAVKVTSQCQPIAKVTVGFNSRR